MNENQFLNDVKDIYQFLENEKTIQISLSHI